MTRPPGPTSPREREPASVTGAPPAKRRGRQDASAAVEARRQRRWPCDRVSVGAIAPCRGSGAAAQGAAAQLARGGRKSGGGSCDAPSVARRPRGELWPVAGEGLAGTDAGRASAEEQPWGSTGTPASGADVPCSWATLSVCAPVAASAAAATAEVRWQLVLLVAPSSLERNATRTARATSARATPERVARPTCRHAVVRRRECCITGTDDS